jgi:uncharacterized protein YjiS (DUF1127 family)
MASIRRNRDKEIKQNFLDRYRFPLDRSRKNGLYRSVSECIQRLSRAGGRLVVHVEGKAMTALAPIIVIFRAGVREGSARLAAWQRQRQTYEALMRCSDHLLADVGIEREHIARIASGIAGVGFTRETRFWTRLSQRYFHAWASENAP